MEHTGFEPVSSDCEPDALPAEPLAVVASRTSYGITYAMKKSVVGNTTEAVLIFMNG